MQYTDIALAAVLCSNAQVPAAETTTTPHLIGGKVPHRSLEFFYSLTCKGPAVTLIKARFLTLIVGNQAERCNDVQGFF